MSLNTARIFRESIKILLLHPTHFKAISIFLFSPLSVSLFLSHFLLHTFPCLQSSLSLVHPKTHFLLFGYDQDALLIKMLSSSLFALVICLPSFLTFSLLGEAATVESVASFYKGGVIPTSGRLVSRGGGAASAWVNLLHICFLEFLALFALSCVFLACLAVVPTTLAAYGMVPSRALGGWVVVGVLGGPFCLGCAHVMVVGGLGRVVAVVEGDSCHGFVSFTRADGLVKGRRQTALLMGLVSNVGLRVVEGMFELRILAGMSLWEVPILVSIYSFMLLLDTIMRANFYYLCKPYYIEP